jgi:hypothetical protein
MLLHDLDYVRQLAFAVRQADWLVRIDASPTLAAVFR